MKIISSSSKPLEGEVSVPGDKSISHRVAVIAAMAHGKSRIENFLGSGVTQVMLDALTKMNVAWELNGNILHVEGKGVGKLTQTADSIYCGHSGTTMRIFAGVMAMAGMAGVLDGSDGLRRRPMDRIVKPLQQMGVKIQSSNGFAPLSISKSTQPLRGIEYTLPVPSAQVKTCILFSALAAEGPTTISEQGVSRDHTERLFHSQGFTLTSHSQFQNGATVNTVTIEPPPTIAFSPLDLKLPGDFSSAAFLIVAALIVPGSSITLRNVGLNPTRTGLLDALLAMGADIRISSPSICGEEPVANLQIQHSALKATKIAGEEVVRMIDEFPIFAVAAAYANGTTLVNNTAELRNKESDRIACMCEELRNFGVQITETQDGFIIEGGKPLTHANVTSHNDHRLAMSLTIASLGAKEGAVISGAEVIKESYPGFLHTLRTLGADIKADIAW